jgi:acetyl esterase/lipase
LLAPVLEPLAPLIVRALARLPAPLQLLLAGGRPIRRDGQLLEPEVQLMLRLLGLVERRTFETLPVPEARESLRAEAALFAPRVPLPMAQVEEVTVSGASGPLRARLYVPSGVPESSALLVYFHGGGFVCGDLETHDAPCRFLARHARLRVLSVDYRLAPEHRFPAPVEDGLAALRFAFSEAERLGANPRRIAVGGDSAGGNLAAVVAQVARGEGPAPALQLLIYPVTDWSRQARSYHLFGDGFFLTEAQMTWYRAHYLGGDAQAARDPRASPLLADDLGGMAPAHVVVAGFDPLRDEGIAYARRLEDAGVEVTLHPFWGLVHGFVNATAASRSSAHALGEVAQALRERLAEGHRTPLLRR